MKKILRIFDLSSYAHAGHVNSKSFIEGDVVNTAGGYVQKNTPTGGVSLLFNVLYNEYGKSDVLFCADRNPTIKKGMLETYKSNRSHKEEIQIEKDVMEHILEDCGFTVLYAEGYEADDFIYSAVQMYKKQYDHIYVHTGDSDLYLLVSDNVSIAKTHSWSKDVDIASYPYSNKKSGYTPYNSMSFLKVLNGDSSDCIPAYPNKVESQLLYDSLNTPFYLSKMGDKVFMRETLKFMAPWIIPQFDLVYPLDVDILDDIKPGDKAKVGVYGYLMKNYLFPYSEAVYAMQGEIVAKLMKKCLYID